MKINIFSILLLSLIASACLNRSNKPLPPIPENLTTGINSLVVTEVIQGARYTYLKGAENGTEFWVAIGSTEVNVGEKYYYSNPLRMDNFESKELSRTFETIYFISKLSNNPIDEVSMPKSTMGHSGKKRAVKKNEIAVAKTDRELTLAELFENRKLYANKEIEIKGVVVKVNKNVMGKNWIHIQDGTKYNANFDLTITSKDIVDLNSEVTFKGTVFLNKNFGSGYFYDLIVENAILLP